MFDKNYKLYSFDIFDTLITRKVAKPAGIFVLMQHILNTEVEYQEFPKDIKANFYYYRVDAEFYLRRLSKVWHHEQEIKFKDLYLYLAKNYALSTVQREQLEALEIRLERENLLPIQENIDKVKALLVQKKRVVLISAMYLPLTVIKQMVSNADPVLADLKIYLSSEVGHMKATASLYKYVQTQEKVDFKQWVHLGDNAGADYSKPKELGIHAHLYRCVRFKKYEEGVLARYFFDPVVQLTLGCAKNVVLNGFQTDEKAILGISLTGAILYPYVVWVLRQCQKRSIHRLYFIARDGYVLKAMADLLIAENHLQIKTFYTYGSRMVWRMAGVNVNNEQLYKQFIDMFNYDIRHIHRFLGLEKQELMDMLPVGLKNLHDLTTRKAIYRYLLSNKEIVVKALEKNQTKINNFVNYLKKNVDYSDDLLLLSI